LPVIWLVAGKATIKGWMQVCGYRWEEMVIATSETERYRFNRFYTRIGGSEVIEKELGKGRFYTACTAYLPYGAADISLLWKARRIMRDEAQLSFKFRSHQSENM
jgi:hypothetical protein